MDPLDVERTVMRDTPAPPQSVLQPGAVLGQYCIIRLLGRGGMGEVYEAEHRVLGRRFAIKLLPQELVQRSGSMERFEREARVMANLEHPHIVRVDDFGETEGRCWLRMEMASGVKVQGSVAVTLQDLAAAYGGRIEQRLLAGILEQVLSGLAYAHGRGVVHRDLKPSNILIWADGEGAIFKIADFGLARLVGEDWLRSRAELTVRASMSLGGQPTAAGDSEGSSTRSLLGTYEYMSPEQKRGEEADARSDIFAVGLMAYRLLTGRGLGVKRPSEIVKDLDPRWDALVIGAMEEDRVERTGSCAELLEAVKALAVEDPGSRKESSEAGRGAAAPPGPQQESVQVVTERRPAPASPVESRKAGDPMSIDLGDGVKLDLVWIPPGEFVMGSPQEELGRSGDEIQHLVTITLGFWMGKFPVTQRQYQQLIGENPSQFKDAGPDAPVESVGWNQAKAFFDCLQARLPPTMNGLTARLPTEAEWEYACRAGTTTALNNGKPLTSTTGRCPNLDEVAWYDENGDGTTHSVLLKKRNAWGLHDMLGNVWERCEDGYETYPSGFVADPKRISSGSVRVIRGGCWLSYAKFCRSAIRSWCDPACRLSDLGFRVVVGR